MNRMALFGKKSEGYLGVDIGASGIKIVECVNEKGKPRLANYAFSVEPLETVGKKDLRLVPEETAALLQKIIAKAKMQGTRAVASLPTYSVFTSVITIPEVERKALTEEIKEKAKRIIPLPSEEMVLDWKVLPSPEEPKESAPVSAPTSIPSQEGLIAEKPKRMIRVLLTAAQRKLVENYVQIFKLAKLDLVSLETEAFALIRSLVGNDRGTTMLVDIGAVNADLSVIKDLTPILNRSLSVGGIHISKTLAENLSTDLRRAEEIKKDLGLSLQTQGPAREALKEIVAPIIHEIRYTAQLYGGPIEKIILTGGSAYLPSFPEYLQEALNVRVVIGNPWSRLIYPKGLEGVLQEIGPRFSVAIGLAMREIV
jgi:type IV pilus assembly protein PilM